MRFFIIILLCSINLNAFGQDTLALSKQVFEQNNYTQTIILLDEYTKHHTNDSAAFELCGDAYFEMNLYTNAAHNFSKAIAIVKSNGLLQKKRALALFLNGDYKASLYDWEFVCRKLPNDKNNWYYLGITQQQTTNYNQAIVSLTEAIKLDSVFVEALQARANLFLKTQQYQLALYDIDSALKITQFIEQQFINRGLALLGLKKYKDAEQMFERVIKRNEKNVHAWFGLGNAYQNSYNYAKAIDAYDVCVALRPDFELAYFKRGLSKLEINKAEQGCEDIMQSLKLGYTDAMVYLKKFCNKG